MTNDEERTVVVICGPTAVGKTKYAIETAKAIDGEIVSCDSMQIYKYMDIGSAKPSKEELSEVRHHLVDKIDPRKYFSVATYCEMAKRVIEDIFARGKIPVVAGGTGLYLNSLLYDMDFAAPPQDALGYREKLYAIASRRGAEYLHAELAKIDAVAAERIHPNNIKKVVRAIEAAEFGEGIDDFSQKPTITKDYYSIKICLNRNREELYARIDHRVDQLMEAGLEEEVKSLMDSGLSADDISMKGIGYKELIAYFNGEYDREEAIRLIKRNSRHLAKRQLTWFKRYDDMNWFNISEFENDSVCIGEILRRIGDELGGSRSRSRKPG